MNPAEAYADSSFLLSLLVEDANTAAARRWLLKHPTALVFNPFHRLEVRNGLRLRVWRGEITAAQRASALRQVDEDLEEGILIAHPLPWTEVLRRAEQLSADHAETCGVRSSDVLHVAAALRGGWTSFLTFDKRQRTLARSTRLAVSP